MNPTVAIRDESFEASKASSYQLCLEMSKDRFRFCILDLSIHTCFWLEDYTFPTLLTENPLLPSLRSIYQDHPVLQSGFWKSIHVSVNSPSFTLVPSSLFRKEYATNYLQLMRGSALSSQEHTRAYAHAREGFHNVFSIENSLSDWLVSTYPLQEIKVVHQTSALIQASAAADTLRRPAQNLILYFEDEFITIIYRHHGSLQFCNKFAYKNTSDLTYYVLYIMNELSLMPQDTQVTLFGEITQFAETYTLLEKFLPHLVFGEALPGLTFTDAFNDLPEHRYFSLFGNALID